MKACIILNGEVRDYKIIKNIINNNYDYIICADGGCNHAYNMDIIPNYIIGDLDSSKSEVIEHFRNCNVQFEKFPCKKDETDTELCIYLANNMNVKKIDFIGAIGGRVDHMIANINLLYYTRKMGITPRILTENEEISIALNEEVVINGNCKDVLSIIPLMGDANGVSLEGLEYNLDNYNIKFGLPLGISNIMLDTECSIKVNEGSLLIIRNK